MNPNIDMMPLPNSPAESSSELPGNVADLPVERRPEKIKEHGLQPVATDALKLRQGLAGMAGQGVQNPSNHTSSRSIPGDTMLPTHDNEMDIEKQCITKAKLVVSETRQDPYAQTKEISKVKADLLKRRYDKEFKLNEG